MHGDTEAFDQARVVGGADVGGVGAAKQVGGEALGSLDGAQVGAIGGPGDDARVVDRFHGVDNGQRGDHGLTACL